MSAWVSRISLGTALQKFQEDSYPFQPGPEADLCLPLGSSSSNPCPSPSPARVLPFPF